MNIKTKWLVGGGTIAVAIAAIGIAHASFHHHGYGKGYHGFGWHGYSEVSATQDSDHHHGRRGHAGRFLKKLDTDNDEKVSRDELMSFIQTHFDALDTNQDGSISVDEFGARQLKRFSSLDGNNDDILSPEEWPRHKSGRKHHKDASASDNS